MPLDGPRVLMQAEFRRQGNLHYHVNPPSSCNYHRIALPSAYMPEVDAKVPVLWYNRMCTSHEHLDRLRAQGYRVVIDIDDDVVLGKDHLLYESYQSSGMTNCLIGNIKRADIVLVTNGVLADRIRDHNPRIVIVPNALPFDQGQFTRTSYREGRKIVYAMGATHFEDLKSILPSVPRDEIVLAGYEHASPVWTKIRSMWHFAEFRPVLGTDEYMRHYDGRAIAIAPLMDTTFNRCKSNLKMLEAGAKGLAFVAQSMHPYLNDTDRDFVVYAGDKSEWRSKLSRLVDDDKLREAFAAQLAEHVREHYQLAQANEIRRQVFESFS